jgi:hypothetical protein
MTTQTATTSQRLTFQPTGAGNNKRHASIPANTPVTATRNQDGTWHLLADVDGPADYELKAADPAEVNLHVDDEPEEVDCVPWCTYGDGHPAGDDAYCTGLQMRVRLSQHPWTDMGDGTETIDNVVVHAEHHHHITGESGVFIGHGDRAGLHLTDKEALALASALMRAVDDRMPEVMGQ